MLSCCADQHFLIVDSFVPGYLCHPGYATDRQRRLQGLRERASEKRQCESQDERQAQLESVAENAQNHRSSTRMRHDEEMST